MARLFAVRLTVGGLAWAAYLWCLVLSLGGCVEQGTPDFAAVVGKDNMPAVDFKARGLAPKGSSQGGYGTLGGGSPAGAAVFSGVSPDASGSREDGKVRYADASDDGVIESGGGYQLNFESADVGAVAKAVLGDVLKANYLIDKRVSGQITLTSSQPVRRARLVPLLESTLASIGAALVKDQDLYRIVPSSDAGGIGTIDGREESEGYGTSVITARYLPAANLGHLLEGFGSRPGSVHTDAGTNLVIVQGTASERKAALDAAALVDVDWLRSKSVAILPVANSAPDAIIAEVNHILDSGEGGLAQGAVQLEPISRMNAVLAVARRPEGLDLVRRWVARLDRSDPSVAGVKVYRLQFAQAKTVATALNELFGNGSGAGGSDKDQLEPGGGAPGQTGSPADASGGQASSGRGSVSSAGFGTGSSGQDGGSGGSGSGSGGAASPFGALKASMTSESAKARAAIGDTEGLGSGGGGPKIRVTADPGSNSVLINASASDYKVVERAIHQMDRQPVQVAIDATIAEVTLTDQLQYGVQFFLQGNKTLGLGGASNLQVSSLNTAGLNLLAGGLSNPRVLVSALQGYTTVKILSSPSLVVLDRQPAVLQVGNEVPILTRTAQSVDTSSTAPVVNNVDYKDTGIILNVLPKVNANGIVTLDVEQQVSAVTSTDATTLTPTFSQRRVRSSIAVASGQTVMLAGLISDTRSTDRSGIPGLGSIRFLNDILTSHDSALARTEIIIFIKPRIITNQADAQDVAEEFRDRLQVMHHDQNPTIRHY